MFWPKLTIHIQLPVCFQRGARGRKILLASKSNRASGLRCSAFGCGPADWAESVGLLVVCVCFCGWRDEWVPCSAVCSPSWAWVVPGLPQGMVASRGKTGPLFSVRFTLLWQHKMFLLAVNSAFWAANWESGVADRMGQLLSHPEGM